MFVDVKGKVNNLTLRPCDRLVPVLEAIINSIQATKDGEKANIVVTATRQNHQGTLSSEENNFQQIESFEIEDFGLGFNSENYKSFKTAESTYKSGLGCKGVGRFTWLKSFEEIIVNSVFYENDNKKKLEFSFSVDDDDFSDDKVIDAPQHSLIRTKISLNRIRPPYREKIPKDLESIASEIIEHCLIYFLENKIDSFTLKDNHGNEHNLVSIFINSYSNEIKSEEFKLGNNNFKSYFLKNNRTNKQKYHKAFFCADSRSVKGYTLKEYQENTPPTFEELDGTKFNYSIYITSSYLDKHVNQERTDFLIADKDDLIIENSPAINTIIIEAMIFGSRIFEPFIEPMLLKHKERIESYVSHNGYEYRHILNKRPNWIRNIPFDLSDSKLDIELHKLNRNYEVELKNKAVGLKNELKKSKVFNLGAYKDSLKEYTEDLNEAGKSNLAKYVVHRKAVLDAFEFSLELQSDDKYALEDAVHDIIIPIRSTSDDINDHNLWLIDERMAYHKLLASDKSFRSVSDIDSTERPDLLVFNNPIIYGDSRQNTSTAIIVEFKRPMRDDYTTNENPIDQVLGYVSKIRKPNKIADDRGREIHLENNIPVYCYIICDLTSSIRELLDIRGFKPLLDNQGYIFYNDNLNAVIEVMSFDKLLSDAQKRNRILFKKLNLE